jgi:hypothetical protein
MKTIVLIFCVVTILSNARSQSIGGGNKTLSQEEYKKYFPVETQLALFVPSTDFVCILPTNEKDSGLQKEVNEYYKQTFIKNYPIIPNQVSKVITDKEALYEDLSKINVHAFGTIEGNLWIRQFIEKAKDFPIKIFEDSIIAGKTYHGNDYVVTALWYNPVNPKYSVSLYIPQNLEYAKSAINRNSFQYTIWQKGKKVIDSYFQLRDNRWHFSDLKDTMLTFRDVNHVMPTNNLEKIDRYYYRFPTLEQLNTCLINEKDIPFDTIKIAENCENFSNTKDMEWLSPIAKKYKIIAVGESHHLKYNKFLLERILFALNTYDYFPLLVLELPYSYAGYFNYYLSLDDEKTAKIFYDSVLTKIYKPDLKMLTIIRNWNREHPEKKIQIACSDLEQDFTKTIKLILNPYLKTINPDEDFSFTVNDTLKGYLDRAKQLLEIAKKQNTPGEYPFQTPEYMENVVENLISSIPIKLDPKKFTDHTDRYRVMIRNLTDKRFLGVQVADKKCLFYGGSEHFRILNERNIKQGKITEGYYLAHNFEATRGKIYTINLNILAISIEDSIPRIDPNLRFTTETDLIDLYKKGKIKLREPVVGFSTSDFEKYIFKLSNKYGGYSFRIKNIKLENVLDQYEGFHRFSLFMFLNILSDFDTNIMIPYSPIGD